jgi:dTDP-4-dehydrorhamnose 3,5-epimerase
MREGPRSGLLDGVVIFNPATFEDDRGFFREAFRLRDLEEIVRQPVSFLQINHSRSHRNVLRGLHAENWSKLIYVPSGEVFAAFADIRPWSPTFGLVETVRFSETSRPTVFLPAGVANGYCVLSETADYIYYVTGYYDGSDTRAVMWDDPDLAVPWPTRNPILSARDRQNPTLRELISERFRDPLPAV